MVSISTLRRIVERRDAARGLDAVHRRHPHVHHDHVGMPALEPPDGVGAVDRLAHHLEVGLGLEDHAEPPAHQRLIVGDHHPDRRAVAHAVGPPSYGSVRVHREPSARTWPRRDRAAVRARRARACRSGPARRPSPRTALGRRRPPRHRAPHRPHRSSTLALRRARVLQHVRERLLHDAVGGQVEPGRKRPRRHPRSRPRRARPRHGPSRAGSRAGRVPAAARGRRRPHRPSGCRSTGASRSSRHGPWIRSGRSPPSPPRDRRRARSGPRPPAPPSRSSRGRPRRAAPGRSEPVPPRPRRGPLARGPRRCGVAG